MRGFDELVAEAESADITGWGFGWLTGRATEERPPWRFSRLLAQRLAAVERATKAVTKVKQAADAELNPPGPTTAKSAR